MANERFKVKFGLAVGDTSATIDATSGDITTAGNAAVNGGQITTTATNALVFNANATTVNAFGAATTLNIGNVSGTTTVNGNLTVGVDVDVRGGDITNTTGALQISSTGSNNITINPGSGTTLNDGNLILGQLNTAAVLTTNGTGNLDIRTGSWPTSANITMADGADGDITIDTDGTGEVIINAALDVNGNITADLLQIDNIQINGNDIISTNTDGNINIIPNGTGDVYLTTDAVYVGDLNATATISTNGTGNLVLNTNANVNSGSITIANGANGNITLAPNGTGITVANTRFSALGGSSLGDTVAIGGASVDVNGLYPIIASALGPPVSPTLFVDNTDAGRIGVIALREYGQNRPGGTSATNALPVISLEGKRGTATSTGAGTQTATNNVLGVLQMGGFNGTSFISSTGTGGNPSQLLCQAAEDFVADTASFTGYITTTTLTVTSGTNVHPGLLLSATGILDGTCIIAYGTGTGGVGTYTISRSQTLFSVGTPGSFTGAGTSNAGSRWIMQYQPQGVKFNSSLGISASRQTGFSIFQIPASTTSVSGVTIPINPGPSITLGDAGAAAENILTSSDGSTRYNRIGLSNVQFVNGAMVISGVTGNDTATITADIGTTTMTVSAVSSGTLSVGQQVYGTGVSQLTRITAQLTSATAALATTTATGTNGTATITVASATGIAVGQLVIATGVPNDTLVINIVGTTVTLSRNLTAGLSATAINFYTAGSTGTYTVTPSQTVASTTMVTGPDNYQLIGSNALQVVGGRQSGVGGRRQPIKNNDTVAQMAFRGVNTRDATGFVLNTNLASRITARATEDFSTARAGSRFTIETAANGGTALTERISTASDSTTFRSDSYTFQNSSGTNITGNNINYNRVYGQWQYNTLISPVAANTAYVFPLGTPDFNNIATVGSTSRLIPGAAGIYNLQFSVQINNADNGSEHFAYIWLRKNGADVTNSMGRVGVVKNGDNIASWNYLVDPANSTDYFELAYAVDSTQLTFPTYAATAFGPSTAALITTLTPVGA